MEYYTLPLGRLITVIILSLLTSLNIWAQDSGYFIISLDVITDQPDNSLQQKEKNSASQKVSDVDRYFTIPIEDNLTSKGEENVKEENEIPSYFRLHKTLPSDFSGYVIELLQSEEKLLRNYPLFNRFGNIHVQQLDNGNYSYCIIVDFKKPSRVKIFANEVILPHAPDAQVLRYRKGKCKKM